MPKFAALRAGRFSAIQEKPQGGGRKSSPARACEGKQAFDWTPRIKRRAQLAQKGPFKGRWAHCKLTETFTGVRVGHRVSNGCQKRVSVVNVKDCFRNICAVALGPQTVSGEGQNYVCPPPQLLD